MSRLEKFRGLAEHAWFGRSFKKLSKSEIIYAEEWIIAHDHLGLVDFELKCNRMGLDNPDKRASFKNYERMQELISSSNVKRGNVI